MSHFSALGDKLKIAFFNPVISGRGGVESVLCNLIAGLERDGDSCRLYIFGESTYKDWLRPLPWWRGIQGSRFRPLRLLGYLMYAALYLRTWNPDVIVACDTTTTRLARWARRVTGLRRTPVLCWLHCSYRFQKMRDEVVRADANLCICKERADEVRALLAQHRTSASQTKPVFLVYSGTAAGSRPPIPRAQTPTFIFSGRIQYESTKRIKDLLDAAGQLRGDFRIKLLGDGAEEEKEKIRSRAVGLGIADKVEWLGWHADGWSAVNEASAMVLPSDAEGFSMVTIEALALGLPVILADFGGVSKEAVVPGETGWMFPVADANALAKILQSIVDDPAILPPPEPIRTFARRFSTEQMIVDFRKAARAMILRPMESSFNRSRSTLPS